MVSNQSPACRAALENLRALDSNDGGRLRDRHRRRSGFFGQFYQDLVVLSAAFGADGALQQTRSYVDLAANTPRHNSNTYVMDACP